MLVTPNTGGFGLWVEQLIAESTGKDGKGLVPVLIEADGDDVQPQEARLPDPYELGQEFFRWEFATAVAGSILGDQPVRPAGRPGREGQDEAVLLRSGEAALEPEGSLDEAARERDPGRGLHRDPGLHRPRREAELEPLIARARATGCVVTTGLGPRYLHSTGQLHKGGPNTGVFVQVVDDLGEELAIPGRDFGFRRLIAAQAVGDYQALKERGRRIVRVRLEEVAG